MDRFASEPPAAVGPKWHLPILCAAAGVITFVLLQSGGVAAQPSVGPSDPLLTLVLVDEFDDGRSTELVVFRSDEPLVRSVLSEGVPLQVRLPAGADFQVPAPNGVGDVLFAEISCNSDDLSTTGTGIHGPMPPEDVTCVYTAEEPTWLTVVTEAPDDPTYDFAYQLQRLPTPSVEFSQAHGESSTFLIHPRTVQPFAFLHQSVARLGWSLDITCVGDSDPASISFRESSLDRSEQAQLGVAGGTHTTCTFANAFVGTGTVSFEFSSDDPAARWSIGGTTGWSEQPVQQEFTAGAEIETRVLLRAPSSLASVLQCDHDGLEFEPPLLLGSLEAGDTAVCSVQTVTAPLIPLKLKVVGDGGPYMGQVDLGFTTIEQFDLMGGEAWQGQVPLGRLLHLGVEIERDPQGWRPAWSVRDFHCLGDGHSLKEGGLLTRTKDFASVEGVMPTDAGITSVTCELLVNNPRSWVNPTVSCLSGNGRIDVNLLGGDPYTSSHYRVEIGDLAPRERTLKFFEWWRSPVTGRPDGPLRIRVFRNGLLAYDKDVVVACDTAPSVDAPEITELNSCKESGGFILWQFANPTATTRGYVIAFEGVPNRSTSAAAYGAAVRGVSSRPDGEYRYTIRADGVLVREDTVRVSCERFKAAQLAVGPG